MNEKFEPRWVERFVTRFLMFTNKDDAIPLSETDRRVYAVRCAEQPKDEVYYRTLYADLAVPMETIVTVSLRGICCAVVAVMRWRSRIRRFRIASHSLNGFMSNRQGHPKVP